MSKILAHLGGVFLYSENPKALAEWYTKHLGMEYIYTAENKAYVATFNYHELEDKDTKRYVVWSISHTDKRPAFREGKLFTINYRVHDMEATLAHLRSLGIETKGPETHEQGIFAWISDPDGNAIEIWEDNANE